jgi:predicted RNase H-like HicB family nuclease
MQGWGEGDLSRALARELRLKLQAAKVIFRGMKVREYNVIIERDAEGWLVASVPQLPGCHTQAKSLDLLMERIREAIELCVEEQGEQEPLSEFLGVQKVTL